MDVGERHIVFLVKSVAIKGLYNIASPLKMFPVTNIDGISYVYTKITDIPELESIKSNENKIEKITEEWKLTKKSYDIYSPKQVFEKEEFDRVLKDRVGEVKMVLCY